MLDLCYTEDSAAEVDMNIVMSGGGEFIEVQGTAEGDPFDRDVLDQLLDLGAAGCAELAELQRAALLGCDDRIGSFWPPTTPRSWPSCAGSWPRPLPTSRCSGWPTCRPTPNRPRPSRTFEGNALLKARACVAATGLPALADDSGLAVDVLNGMPGVRSARWAGPQATDADNNELLLRQLPDVAEPDRTARFVCAMAAVLPGRDRTRPSRRHVGAAGRALRGARMASATTRCSWPTGTP